MKESLEHLGLNDSGVERLLEIEREKSDALTIITVVRPNVPAVRGGGRGA